VQVGSSTDPRRAQATPPATALRLHPRRPRPGHTVVDRPQPTPPATGPKTAL